jgi:hypothetical protein
MKKHLFLLLALFTSITISAQNLALGCTTKGLPSSTSEALAVDGNLSTRYESAWQDNVVLQFDLGAAKDFNTIQIVWESAYAKSFTIVAGNSVDEDGFVIDDEGTQVASEVSQTLSDFPNTQTFTFNKVNARYVKFHATERPEIYGAKYGYSFYEFRVLNASSSTLTTLSIAPTTTLKNAATTAGVSATGKVGVAIPFKVSAQDQDQLPYSTEGITYSVEGAGGTVADGAFTPTAKGLSTVTATLGGKTASFKVYAYDGDNIALGRVVDKSGDVEGYSAAYAADGNNDTRWASGHPDDAANHDYNSFLTLDLAAYYDIDYVDLFFENANSSTYTIQFSKDGTTWTDAYSEADLAGYQGGHYGYCTNTTDNKQVRFVKLNSTKAATDYGVSVYELAVYGSNKTAIADTEAPVLNTAEVASVGTDNVKLNLKATDNISSINYVITDAASEKQYTTTGANGAAVTYQISGFSPETAYSFNVVAKDANGNVSNAKTVTFTTLAIAKPATPAPAPTPAAADVKSVYGEHYTCVTPSANFDTWWSGGEVLSQYEVATGDQTESVANFGYLGFDFGGSTTIVDASDMQYLHFDVYPESITKIGVTPIIKTASGSVENGKEYSLTAGQWNSINIPLTDFSADKAEMDFSKVFQIKWYGGDGKSLIYLDNIFFSKTSSATGITNILSNTGKASGNVYSIDGRLVKKTASINSSVSLPKGIYVMNGKKVVVK